MRNTLLILSLTGLAGTGYALIGVDAGEQERSPKNFAVSLDGQRNLFNEHHDSQIVPRSFDLERARSVRYASERSPHKFAGATRVVLDGFDPLDKNAKSARLQLDNNDVTFSEFGDQRITVAFYQSFQVSLTRRDGADPTLGNRIVFAMELPKENAVALGENSLQLVAPVGLGSEPRGVRLLLLNLQRQVTDTLELRPPRDDADALRLSAFP